MSKKVVKVSLTSASIDNAIQELKNYQKWLIKCSKKFVEELAKEGENIARVKFSQAEYDGTNDVDVTVEKRGDLKTAVVATGGAVLFIEFGTGITYPDVHPNAGELGMIRGGYGRGMGKRKGWVYRGDPGTNGEVLKNGKVLTRGNPANMSMYNTVKELEEHYKEVARRCFV